MTVVLAIDPSIRSTGFAVIDNGKLVHTGRQPLRDHSHIHQLVSTLYTTYGLDLDLVAIEAGYVSVNAKVGLQLAELRGALTYAWRDHGIRVTHVLPSAWRKTTIKPPAKTKRKELKRLAQAHVMTRYGVSVSDDEADAVCIAEHFARPANDNADPTSLGT